VKPEVRRWLLLLLALGGTLVAGVWVSEDEGQIVTAAPTRERKRDGGRESAARKGGGALPELHLEHLAARRFDEMKLDLFATKSWYVPPPPPLPPKPKPPPLPFVFAGRMIEDGRTTVFLSRPGSNQAVKTGDIVDRIWQVGEIAATSMIFTYLPLNEHQTLALGVAP
jgi:hypothetical protein